MNTKDNYVVAVSGGVDSVVLLHKLMQQHKLESVHRTALSNSSPEYIIAHFDHGIRVESSEDRKFVEKLANDYDLKFEYSEGNLGAKASEATARTARYKFLRSVAKKHKAEKIITAHHSDDLLETMVLNIIRGTGPRGLAPMKNNNDILRPLINRTKDDLINYARENNLEWREDSTNNDEKYLRNYVRKNIMPKLQPKREELLKINKRAGDIYTDIDLRISLFIPKKNILHRATYVRFPFSVRREIMKSWLESLGVRDINRNMINKLTVSACTLSPNKIVDINKDLIMLSQQQNIIINRRD